ncbi:MAG: hypothetical protein V4649_13685 [Bacteroidota bacterium]
MILKFDIEKKVAPFIRLSAGIYDLPSHSYADMNEALTDIILAIEGFEYHIFVLPQPEAKGLLGQVNKVLSVFIDLDDKYAAVAYLKDEEFKERFLYALKVLYKFRSLLHIAATKNKPVTKTPEAIKEGLAAISRRASLLSLSKHNG